MNVNLNGIRRESWEVVDGIESRQLRKLKKIAPKIFEIFKPAKKYPKAEWVKSI